MYKVILLIMCTLLIPAQVPAMNDRDVRFTVHNLNTNVNNNTVGLSDDYRNLSSNVPGLTEVCVFCHTPHNASPSVPLWNKSYNGTDPSSYKLYTSSQTLTSVAKAASITANSESMLCLSCHDGKTAINVLHNTGAANAYTGTTGSDYIMDMGWGGGAISLGDVGGGLGDLRYTANIGATRGSDGKILDPRAGTNLTDDHPIGFSYSAAQALKPTALHPIGDVTAGHMIRFFGPGRDRLECSSCHDPHVFYGSYKSGGSRIVLGGALAPTPAQKDRTPFLVRDNNGSALCLSCHIK